MPSRRPGWHFYISENCSVSFSTMLVTVCAQNLCGLFCKDVSKFIFVSVRSFLGCLWSFLRSITLSYSSSSWMDRRNSILLFGSHSHSSRFKVKGLKLFYPPSQKKYYIFLVVLVIFVVLRKSFTKKRSVSNFQKFFGTVFLNCYKAKSQIKQNIPIMKRVNTCINVRRKRYGRYTFSQRTIMTFHKQSFAKRSWTCYYYLPQTSITSPRNLVSMIFSKPSKRT